MIENASNSTRWVLLLDTDERAGLVAALAERCSKRGVSLELTTGPGHVLITFQADENLVIDTASALRSVPGVLNVHPYPVIEA